MHWAPVAFSLFVCVHPLRQKGMMQLLHEHVCPGPVRLPGAIGTRGAVCVPCLENSTPQAGAVKILDEAALRPQLSLRNDRTPGSAAVRIYSSRMVRRVW